MRLQNLSHSEVDVWPAFSDFLTSVLFIVVLFVFAILFVNIARNLIATDDTYKAMQRQQNAVRTKLEQKLHSAVKIPDADGNLQRIILQVDEQGKGGVLFDKGSARLKEEGKPLLDEIVAVLKETGDLFSTVQVEGHTDDDPINTQQFPSNWELSAARAGAVVNYLLARQSTIAPWRFSANGRGEYRPYDVEEVQMSGQSSTDLFDRQKNKNGLPDYVLKNNVGEQAAHNRRIEIILTYKINPNNRNRVRL